MSSYFFLTSLLCCFLLLTLAPQQASSASTAATPTVPPTTIQKSSSQSTSALTSSGTVGVATSGASTSSIAPATSGPPDVLLNVPNLSVGRIELDVDNLQADINLAANVAGLVSINAGVAVSVQNVNLTIVDVEAELELIVRLENLVNLVNRVFQSLDLNPLLITALNNVTSALDTVVGAVDGLLGSVTQGGTTLSFVVDNLGNIVQEVAGTANSTVNTIVGNYLTNMTYTGQSQTLQNGLIQKTYSYSPLNALVNIIFNTAGQIVQAVVAK